MGKPRASRGGGRCGVPALRGTRKGVAGEGEGAVEAGGDVVREDAALAHSAAGDEDGVVGH